MHYGFFIFFVFTYIIFPFEIGNYSTGSKTNESLFERSMLTNKSFHESNEKNSEINEIWNAIGYDPDLIGRLPMNNTPIVAIIDSGINKTLFSPKNIWINLNDTPYDNIDEDQNGFIDDYWGWDFIEDRAVIDDSEDFTDHGTFIANLIIQMVPKVQIMDIRVLGEDNRNPDFIDFYRAIEYVLQFPAVKIIQLSTEFITKSWNPLPERVKWMFTKAYLQDVTIVSVVGNGGRNTLTPPGSWAETIAVSSVVKNTTEFWKRTSYANSGKNIDLVAPGSNIPSIGNSGTKLQLSGTSFASAFVGAAVALIKSVNPNLKPIDIREILHKSSSFLEYDTGCLSYGNGLLNISKALKTNLLNSTVNNSNLFNEVKCTTDYIIPITLPPVPTTTQVLTFIIIPEILLIVSFLIWKIQRRKQQKY